MAERAAPALDETADEAQARASQKKAARTSWRGLNRALHRELGHLAVGLTLVYAISGIAVP